jgi:hypothetical protein
VEGEEKEKGKMRRMRWRGKIRREGDYGGGGREEEGGGGGR